MTRKEKIFAFFQDSSTIPLLEEELAVMLEVPTEDREELHELLQELVAEGKLLLTKRGRYTSLRNMGVVSGVLQGNERGFGFVLQEGEDLFIPAESMGDALHGDTVLARVVQPSGEGKRREGVIFSVVKRGSTHVVGTFLKRGQRGVVRPDDRRFSREIDIPKQETMQARSGQKVVVSILRYPKGACGMTGKITEVLGFPAERDTLIKAVLRQHGIPDAFSPEVTEQANCVPEAPTDQDKKDRLDLRDWQIITIDGEDAKDLDDAVSLRRLENDNWQLGVHIADVSHYVPMGSPMDQEAYRRGTSVYLVDRVVPMLPVALSNGICSLHPHVDRLTLSVLMELKDDQVVDSVWHRSVIRSCERMTYRDVTTLLEESDPVLEKRYSAILPMLRDMRDVAMGLRQKRKLRGSLDFDFPEAKIQLDEQGIPIEISPYETTISHHIIEEFMLLANETIAEYLFWREIPTLYRVHEKPDRDKLLAFSKLAGQLGYPLKGAGEVHPKALQSILQACKGKPEERILSTFMLRSLMKAEYSEQNKGHFGLSAKFYLHFTSPIRRYPDLTVHRVLKEWESGSVSSKRLAFWKGYLPPAAEQTSRTERVAQEAEREVEDSKKAAYMKRFIGDIWEGVISGVMPFGLFVELPNTVEGAVRVADMREDYYQYDEQSMQLIGERTGRSYRIGDAVRVRVVAASEETGQIDFVLE